MSVLRAHGRAPRIAKPGMEPVRDCAGCAHRGTCTLLAALPRVMEERGVPMGVTMPMPCAGELWAPRPPVRPGESRAFARYNPQPAPKPTERTQVGTLADLELPA